MRRAIVGVFSIWLLLGACGCAGVNPLSDWNPIGDFLQSEVDKDRRAMEERERKAEETDRERDRAIAEERREKRRSK